MFRATTQVLRLACTGNAITKPSRTSNLQIYRILGCRPFSETASKNAFSWNLRGYLAGAALAVAVGVVADNQGFISLRPNSESRKAGTKKYASPDEVRKAIAELRDALPERGAVSTDPDALKTFGSSSHSYHPTSPHSVVVQVRSTDDVVKVVDIARKYRVPIVAYSGATSLEGHYSGVTGDIPPNSLPGCLTLHNSVIG